MKGSLLSDIRVEDKNKQLNNKTGGEELTSKGGKDQIENETWTNLKTENETLDES